MKPGVYEAIAAALAYLGSEAREDTVQLRADLRAALATLEPMTHTVTWIKYGDGANKEEQSEHPSCREAILFALIMLQRHAGRVWINNVEYSRAELVATLQERPARLGGH